MKSNKVIRKETIVNINKQLKTLTPEQKDRFDNWCRENDIDRYINDLEVFGVIELIAIDAVITDIINGIEIYICID